MFFSKGNVPSKGDIPFRRDMHLRSVPQERLILSPGYATLKLEGET